MRPETEKLLLEFIHADNEKDRRRRELHEEVRDLKHALELQALSVKAHAHDISKDIADLEKRIEELEDDNETTGQTMTQELREKLQKVEADKAAEAKRIEDKRVEDATHRRRAMVDWAVKVLLVVFSAAVGYLFTQH